MDHVTLRAKKDTLSPKEGCINQSFCNRPGLVYSVLRCGLCIPIQALHPSAIVCTQLKGKPNLLHNIMYKPGSYLKIKRDL